MKINQIGIKTVLEEFGQDSSDIPSPGDNIRTKKMQMEGKVERLGKNRAGYDEVFFRLGDGRLMVTPLSNVIVVEKLADEECGICEEELDEVSTELLAKYKTAAGKDASAADKSGDTARGNKRFSGIVKATKKQFANDAKKKTDEGSMGWINRSAPAVDVSYEKVLDRNPQTAHSKVIGEESGEKNIVKTFDANAAAKETAGQLATLLNRPSERLTPGMIQFIREFETRVYVDDNGNSCKVVDFLESKTTESSKQDLNELSVDKLQSYTDAAKSPASFKNRPLRKLARTIQGVQGANDRIRVKTGDQVGKHQPDRGTYESRLAEFIELDEGDKQIVNIGMTMSGKPGLFTNGMMAVPISPEEYKMGLADRDYLEKLAAKYDFVLKQDTGDVDEAFNPNDFADILGKQHSEVQAAKKKPTTEIPYHGWLIRYRPASNPGDKVVWQVMDKKGDVKNKGESFSDKEAVQDAEDWIKSGGGTSQQATDKVTIDFNVNFAREFAPGGETFYAMFGDSNGAPGVYISTEPQKGFKTSSIRTQKDKATGTTTLLPAVSLSPSEANKVGLKPNGRYILGDKIPEDNNTDFFPLIYQSTSQSKTDTVRLGKPGLTVATSRAVDEAITPWGGYTPDDKKANALSKAPKSTMHGKGDVRFSDMVKDAIETHGLSWAFDYYVKKHGLPPKQFQIFAGLTTKAKAAEPKKPDWTDPSTNRTQPKKKSWWQSLLSKMEE